MKSEKGMRLIKSGKKGLLSAVFSRIGLVVFLLLLQFGLLFFVFYEFGKFYPHYFGSSLVITVIMLLFLFDSDMGTSAKLTWTVIIALLPVFGALLYLYTRSEIGHRVLRRRFEDRVKKTRTMISENREVCEELKKHSPSAASLCKYISITNTHPLYNNSEVTYFPSGEEKFKELLKQLKKAKKYIFLEFFIVEEGNMWGQVLEILAEKVKEGVEVRLMYDGTCEFFLLPRDYPARLEALGIKCKVFSKITPFVSTHYNYRDHRKIVVIDGKVAFTGGINLADEYINEKKRFGHWKDAAVMVKGEAAVSFALMFLQLWGVEEKHDAITDYISFSEKAPDCDASGYVVPYGDSPLDDHKLGERVYMDLLNRSTEYVHIMSPYLILDGEMENAVKFAAERGVEVTIILPGVPDKKIPYALAKTHYRSLLRSGVKIYEYTPGFVHSKVFSCDGREAVVGTINMDYRSFYHHFECALYMYGTSCIKDIDTDFSNTLKKCKRVTEETVKATPILLKLTGFLLKFFAPLM